MKKIPVAERALMARVNRALAKKNQAMQRCRQESRSFHNLGRYYIIDFSRNCLLHSDVDIEAFARQMGILRAYEVLDDNP
jgi:hypothetical protein